MRIPHALLSAPALEAIVEEFVTRDGTDHSSFELRCKSVFAQLEAGTVELDYYNDTATCNIVAAKRSSP
jgi:uncharacterized protein YheU (UPF0270 family)